MAWLIGILTFVVHMLTIAWWVDGAAIIGISREIADAAGAIGLAALGWWAMKDSARIQYAEYESGIALKPSWMAVAMIVASPLVLPWYVADRYRIAKRTLPRKPDAVPGDLGLNDRN